MKSGHSTVLELGGKLYKTIKVNNHIWMAENLSLLVKDSWFYDENATNSEKNGRLYTWDAAVKACPEGWFLPSNEHWDELINFFGGEEHVCQKLLVGGESGFDVQFAGYRSQHGVYLSKDRAADFWTSSEAGNANAWLRYIIAKKDRVFKIIDDKGCGFSVRYAKAI